MLLKEEMRRVRQYLEWKANWWESRSEGWNGLDASIAEGIGAYARRQKAVQLALLERFTKLWEAPLACDKDTEDVGEGEDTQESPVWDALAGQAIVPSDDED